MQPKYPFIASNNPNNIKRSGIGFYNIDEAFDHCNLMNAWINTYDTREDLWDKNFWTSKPQLWYVYKND